MNKLTLKFFMGMSVLALPMLVNAQVTVPTSAPNMPAQYDRSNAPVHSHYDQNAPAQMQQRAPAAQDGQNAEYEKCAKDILKTHFPEKYVQETLKKFNVPEDQRSAIVSELNEKDKNIVKMVEEKAAQMEPNPLKDPSQRQAAVRLFRETLVQQFTAVLKAHGVTNDQQIQEMLDDIQLQKAKQFTECMEKMNPNIRQKKPGYGPAPAPASPMEQE